MSNKILNTSKQIYHLTDCASFLCPLYNEKEHVCIENKRPLECGRFLLDNIRHLYFDERIKSDAKISQLEKQAELSLKERNELAESEYKTVLCNSKLLQELKEKNQCILDLCEEIRCLKNKIEIAKNVIKNFDLEYKKDIQNRDEYLRQVGEYD